MSVTLPIHLRTLEREVTALHGRPRPLTADERAILADGAQLIVQEIRERWPRETGFSAARWTATISGAQGEYSITVSNDADYVQYVRRAGATEPLWETLVPAVVRALGPRITEVVLNEARRTEERLRAESEQGGQPIGAVLIDTIAQRFPGGFGA